MFKLFSTAVVETGGSVIDTGGKFAAVSLTPVTNMPPVSKTPAVPMTKLAAGVIDTGGAP